MKAHRFVGLLLVPTSFVCWGFGSKRTPAVERMPLGEKPMSSDSKDSHTVAGQYLISFEASVTDAARAELFKKWNVKELEKVGSSPLYLIEISPGPQAEGTVKGLKTGVGVRYVEPNFKMHTFGS